MSKEISRVENFHNERVRFWDSVAQQSSIHGSGSRGYYKRLWQIFQNYVSPGLRVLEIGCSEGDLLASVKPSYGLGIDFSDKMIERARRRHPELNFIVADALTFTTKETFDVIILSDLVNDLWDVQTLLEKIHCYSHSGTRVVLNFYSRLWTPILKVLELFGLARKTLEQNWFTVEDIENLLNLSGFDVIRNSSEVFLPLRIPVLDSLFNKFLVKLWPFRYFALTNVVVARISTCTKDNNPNSYLNKYTVTVVVPARNESGNIAQIFRRLPLMGRSTELLFVEGNSSDDTFKEIQRQIQLNPDIDASLYKQTGKGKGDAVRLGFEKSKGDVLMILDADLTVPPEYLPRFFNALVESKGEFINGVRLIYPMEKQAMRFFNFLGNKFFSLAFSWLLGQPIKDTLCGTKVLWKKDYQKIAENRSYFGDFDPFGDFDLLFGAAKLNMKIVDMPIRYHERVYGTTNIQRWKHGLLLLRMVLFAAGKIKFI